MRTLLTMAAVLLLCVGCQTKGGKNKKPATGKDPATAPERKGAVADDPATAELMAAIRAGKFAAAATLAESTMESAPNNSRVRAVRALVRYQQAGVDLARHMEALESFVDKPGSFDEPFRVALRLFDKKIAAVDADLAVAEKDPNFSLELCLACWEYDWNQNGEIDDRDRLLMQIEFDRSGEDLTENDARRKPTYRFDHGDILWARAMLAFQRGAMQMGLAYNWSEAIDALDGKPSTIVIKLADGSAVAAARDHFLKALGHADRCREAYLAETDDDREWVPNPKQDSYPVPLDVDTALYENWKGVIPDVRNLLSSNHGLSLDELWSAVPGLAPAEGLGFVDLGAIFSKPSDIVIDLKILEALDQRTPSVDQKFAKAFFGRLWAEKMTPSPIIARIKRTAESVFGGEELIERKLRYLFWLN